ncbi:MAG: hypothetical protein K2J71_10265 [Oscillospiraceae bacterium]|nr:hypothetical protein [Oscillospiraceae bacterium]
MQGKINFEIRNKRICFRLMIERNITVLRGNSATGKTTMMEMIRDYDNLGESSGIILKCQKNCRILEGRDWQERLKSIHDSIVFIDEGSIFLKSAAFATDIQKTDNYYVIATRNPLQQLPYSINTIYEIRKNQKYSRFQKLYQNLSLTHILDSDFNLNFDLFITEDQKSGFQFFQRVADGKIACISAQGKSNLSRMIRKYSGKKILVIADAAALGAEIEMLVQYQRLHPDQIFFFLPESFEWLILKSGLIPSNDRDHNPIPEILENPAEYIDCEKYFSWERFFTELLIDRTKEISYMRYSKAELPEFYKKPEHAEKILRAMEKI